MSTFPHHLLLVAASLIAVFTSAAAQDGAMRPATEWALIIGISGPRAYPPKEQLHFADNDARDFADLLGRKVDPVDARHMRVLLNDSCTWLKVREALDWLSAVVRSGDRVYLFISSHGLYHADENRPSFVLWDAKGMVPEAEWEYDFSRVAGRIGRIAERQVRVFVFIDACFSGAMNMELDALPSTFGSRAKHALVFASSPPTKQSKEITEFRNGAFTEFLISGLQGAADRDSDRVITPFELGVYLRDGVKRATIDVAGNWQKPVCSNDDEIPLVELPERLIAQNPARGEGRTAASGGSAVGKGGAGAEDDTSTAGLKNAFYAALDANALVEPEGACALSLFETLRARAHEVPQQEARYLQARLAGSLYAHAHEVILHYLDGIDNSNGRKDYERAAREMDNAVRYSDASEDDSAFIARMRAEALFLEAYALHLRGGAGDGGAGERLRAALRVNPNAVYAMNALGECYTENGRIREAEALFHDAIRAAPGWSYPRINQARLLMQQQRYGEADSLLRHAVESDPEAAYGYFGKAYFHSHCEVFPYSDGELALAEIRQGLDLLPPASPERARYLHLQGSICGMLAREASSGSELKEREVESYREGIAADSAFIPNYTALVAAIADGVGRDLLSEFYSREAHAPASDFRERLDGAERIVSLALGFAEGNPSVLVAKGRIAEQRAAVEQYKKSCVLDSLTALVMRRLRSRYVAQAVIDSASLAGKESKAIAESPEDGSRRTEEAGRIADPDLRAVWPQLPWSSRNALRRYLESYTSDFYSIRDSIRAVIDGGLLAPDSATSWNEMERRYLRIAALRYREATALDSSAIEPYLRLSALRLRSGDTLDAGGILARAARSAQYSAVPPLELGRFYARRGKTDSAALAFREGLRRDSSSILLWRTLLDLYATGQREHEKASLLTALARWGRRTPEYYCIAADHFFLRDSLHSAFRWYRMAAEAFPGHPYVSLRLAQLSALMECDSWNGYAPEKAVVDSLLRSDARVLFAFAEYFARAGRGDTARAMFEKAYALDAKQRPAAGQAAALRATYAPLWNAYASMLAAAWHEGDLPRMERLLRRLARLPVPDAVPDNLSLWYGAIAALHRGGYDRATAMLHRYRAGRPCGPDAMLADVLHDAVHCLRGDLRDVMPCDSAGPARAVPSPLRSLFLAALPGTKESAERSDLRWRDFTQIFGPFSMSALQAVWNILPAREQARWKRGLMRFAAGYAVRNALPAPDWNAIETYTEWNSILAVLPDGLNAPFLDCLPSERCYDLVLDDKYAFAVLAPYSELIPDEAPEEMEGVPERPPVQYDSTALPDGVPRAAVDACIRLHRDADFDGAAAALAPLLEEYPENAMLNFLAGNILFRKERYREALQRYDRAAGVPAYEQALRYNAALTLYLDDDNTRALETLDGAYERGVYAPLLLHFSATILRELLLRHHQTTETYTRRNGYCAICPQHRLSRDRIVELVDASKFLNPDMAVVSMRTSSSDIVLSVRKARNRATEYAMAGAHDMAIEILGDNVLQSAAVSGTDASKAWSMMGSSYYFINDIANARRCQNKAIAADESNMYAWFCLAHYPMLEREYAESRDFFTRALSLTDSSGFTSCLDDLRLSRSAHPEHAAFLTEMIDLYARRRDTILLKGLLPTNVAGDSGGTDAREQRVFEKYGDDGVAVWRLIDGEKTAEQIMEELHMTESRLVEILEWMNDDGLITLEKPPESVEGMNR